MAVFPLSKAPFSKAPPGGRVSGSRPAVRPSAAPGQSGAPSAEYTRVEIELDMDTGQPNARWLLGRTKGDALLCMLPSEPALQYTGPGYRGFIVHIDSNGSKRHVRVFHDSSLERWLLQTGKFCLVDSLVKHVEQQLG